MKKILILTLAIFTLNALAYAQAKIGVINAQEILQKTKKGLEIQKNLEDLQETKQSQMKLMQDEIIRLEKEVVSPALDQPTRETKSQELQKKRADLKRFIEDGQNEFNRESQKRLIELENEVMPIVKNHGITNGFTVILDITRPGIVFYDQAIDVTDDIVRLYDSVTQE